MYKKSLEGWLKHYDFILLDLLCLQTAFVLSYIIRNGFSNPYDTAVYRGMAIFVMLADIAVVFFYESFKGVLKRGYWREFSAVVKQGVMIELLCALYLFTVKDGDEYSRTVMYLTGAIYVVLTYAVRVLWKLRLKKKMANREERSLLIVTTEDSAREVISDIKENNYEMFKLSGVVLTDRNAAGESVDGVPVVADLENTADYVCREWIDEVLISRSSEFDGSQKLAEQLNEAGVTVHLDLSSFAETMGNKRMVEKIGNYTVLTSSLNVMTPKQAFFKRTMDIAVGLVGCIATGVLTLFLAPAIYIQSPGPIFFSQERVGKNGKRFKIYKFRSMYMDAEERKKELMKENRVKDGFMFKLEFDPRVIGNKVLPDGTHKTGIGEFIRKTSLDEFPQFWNVLTGSMSVVGTRPPLISEVELYENHHRARLAVKPGITGMWQVSGRSEITDFEEVVRLDTQYINEWNMGLDFKILLKTVAVVLKKEGSM